MALHVDVEIVFPLARAGRARLEARHRHAVLLERHQDVVHRAGPVRHRDHQAHAVAARGLRRVQHLRQADHGEARAVEGVVLDGVRRDVQAEFAAGALAARCRPRPGCRRPAARLRRCWTRRGARRRAGACSASSGIAPAPAGCASTTSMPSIESARRSRWCRTSRLISPTMCSGELQQQVERARDHALAGVLHRHHAEVGGAGRGGVEHLVEADAGHMLDAGAEELHRRLLAEGADRARGRPRAAALPARGRPT